MGMTGMRIVDMHLADAMRRDPKGPWKVPCYLGCVSIGLGDELVSVDSKGDLRMRKMYANSPVKDSSFWYMYNGAATPRNSKIIYRSCLRGGGITFVSRLQYGTLFRVNMMRDSPRHLEYSELTADGWVDKSIDPGSWDSTYRMWKNIRSEIYDQMSDSPASDKSLYDIAAKRIEAARWLSQDYILSKYCHGMLSELRELVHNDELPQICEDTLGYVFLKRNQAPETRLSMRAYLQHTITVADLISNGLQYYFPETAMDNDAFIKIVTHMSCGWGATLDTEKKLVGLGYLEARFKR